MSYAIRKDGQGWRAVNGPDDVGPDENYSVTQPAPPPGPSPLELARSQRLAAYRAESDPIKIEAEYDAQIAGTQPNYTAWLAKVAAIKARIPLPE